MDITGVMGAVCKHGSPLLILDMKHGERYQYPDCLLLELEKSYLRSNQHDIKIAYDVACKYSAHLRKHMIFKDEAMLAKVTFTIGKMHAYAHGITCKRKYHPLHVLGSGDTDGEACERFWSYIGLFGLMTRKMLPINRHDQLEDAMKHLVERKERGTPKYLCRMYTTL